MSVWENNEGAAEPTPVVDPSQAGPTTPAGSAAPPPPAGGSVASGDGDGAPLDRPEVQVGLAFVGGLLAASVLKRMGGNRRKRR